MHLRKARHLCQQAFAPYSGKINCAKKDKGHLEVDSGPSLPICHQILCKKMIYFPVTVLVKLKHTEGHSSRRMAAPPPGLDTNRLCFSMAARRGSGRK